LHDLLLDYKLTDCIVIAGGNSRQESVLRALSVSNDNYKHVLISDAVRPFVSKNLINRLISKLRVADAVIPAIATTDTIKLAEKGVIQSTLDRSKLFSAQTPQGFSKSLLLKANKTIKDFSKVTDDASIVELSGLSEVYLIEGEKENIKITSPEDLLYAQFLVKILA